MLAPIAVQAVELRSVVVEREDGLFMLESEVWFNAEREALYEVFLNYDLTHQFTSFVVDSRNLEPDELGRRRFFISNQGCVWFICRSFERTGHVEHVPPEVIHSTADPELSDFHTSIESWEFTPEGDGTVVVYKFQFKPKFWLPPVIGPYVLQRKLELDSDHALSRIERLAQENAGEDVSTGTTSATP